MNEKHTWFHNFKLSQYPYDYRYDIHYDTKHDDILIDKYRCNGKFISS